MRASTQKHGPVRDGETVECSCAGHPDVRKAAVGSFERAAGYKLNTDGGLNGGRYGAHMDSIVHLSDRKKRLGLHFPNYCATPDAYFQGHRPIHLAFENPKNCAIRIA